MKAKLACLELTVSTYFIKTVISSFSVISVHFMVLSDSDLHEGYIRDCRPLNASLPNCYNTTFHDVRTVDRVKVTQHSHLFEILVPV